jgi:hypothetical protein
MADDNTRRAYRSNESHRRSANPADPPDIALGGSDPLAELARLIGQPDPYTETSRRQPPAGRSRASQHGYDDTPEDDWRKHIQRPRYDAPEEPAFDPDPRYAPEQHASHDPYRMATPRHEADYADPNAGYADPQAGYADPQADYADPHADYRRDPAYTEAADYSDERMYAAQHRGGYAAERHDDHGGGYPADQHQARGGGVGAYRDDDYDDPPRRGGRGSSLVTAVVLIGCAMLGTAGAYGYRTYSSGSASTQAPVIIADSSPNKVVPEQPKSRMQDRVGGQGSDERLVSREEQPVALQPPGSSVPRIVFPSPVQQAPTTTGTTPSSTASVDQPKPIRTVPIRPDGGDTSGRPFGEEPSRTPPTTRTAPNTRTATTPAPTAPPPAQRAPTRDQPLSLDPASPVQEPARPQQRAVTPPAVRDTAAPKVAAVPQDGGSAGNGGGFIVQVSSQRSEADAQASYRSLQAKYSMLKSHQLIIRRADLGNKGVYYRAMVGPFESGDAAVQFCNDLKQAGGQCIIHRN